MDPSYERKVEYHEVVESTTYVLEKARHAVVMIWYPLLPAEHHQALLAGLRDSGIRKIWQSELLLRALKRVPAACMEAACWSSTPWGWMSV